MVLWTWHTQTLNQTSYNSRNDRDDDNDNYSTRIPHFIPTVLFDCVTGEHNLKLECWRPIGPSVVSQLRRFFVGGSPELEDLSYTRIPTGFQVCQQLMCSQCFADFRVLRFNWFLSCEVRSFMSHLKRMPVSLSFAYKTRVSRIRKIRKYIHVCLLLNQLGAGSMFQSCLLIVLAHISRSCF